MSGSFGFGKVEISDGIGRRFQWRGRSTNLICVATTEKEWRGNGEKK